MPATADLTTSEIGYLRGGPRRAVAAAVAALVARKQVAPLKRGRLVATGASLDGPTDDLEAAVLHAVGAPTMRGNLPRLVGSELNAIRRRLCDAGLIPPRRPQVSVPLMLLGIVVMIGSYIATETNRLSYWWGAAIGLSCLTLLAVHLLWHRRTAEGTAVLATLRERHRDLNPTVHVPHWNTSSPRDVAMSVALFDDDALDALTPDTDTAAVRSSMDVNATGGLGGGAGAGG